MKCIAYKKSIVSLLKKRLCLNRRAFASCSIRYDLRGAGKNVLQLLLSRTPLKNHALFGRYLLSHLKFIYSEKATKCCEISTFLLSSVVPVKSKVEILQNFVAFSEYSKYFILVSLLILCSFYVHKEKSMAQ